MAFATLSFVYHTVLTVVSQEMERYFSYQNQEPDDGYTFFFPLKMKQSDQTADFDGIQGGEDGTMPMGHK